MFDKKFYFSLAIVMGFFLIVSVAMAAETTKFNSTNATTDANEQTGSNDLQQSQSTSDDNKKYNQNDLELARLEGYNDGYYKAYDTIDEYNQGDSGSDSSSNVETTSDSSSSSSDASSSSESANVETTTG